MNSLSQRARSVLMLLAILGLIISVVAPCTRIVHASTTTTFQTTADNYLDQGDPLAHMGASSELLVKSQGGGNRRAILKFDMSGTIPNGATVISAVLYLYYYSYSPGGNPMGRTYNVYRITQTAWTEGGSNWIEYDGTNRWGNSGGDYTATDSASATVPQDFDWMSWTVTAQVQYALNNVGKVAHFLIRDQNEDESVYQSCFRSKEYVSNRPKLEVTYAAIDRIVFTTGAQVLTAGVPSSIMTIQTGDASGAVNVPSDTTIGVTSTSATGQFSESGGGPWSSTLSLTITAGTSSKSFYYQDATSGTPTITAAESPSKGWTDATQQETVNPASLDHFTFATISSPQKAGAAFTITITAKDACENTVTSYTGTNTLSDTTGTINPTSTTTFSSGVWTGSVTISTAQSSVVIMTSGNGKSGTSNTFNVNPSSASVETASGTGLATLSPDPGIIQDLTAISESTLPAKGKPNLNFPHGFFSFKITGLTSGATVTVTITLPSNAPAGTQYWKYGPTPDKPTNHWYQIPIGDDDGDNIITITITDGGIGDDDLTANGEITDQGGPGQQGAVGGVVMPTNKLEILTPCLALAGLVGVATAIFTIRKRRRD